MILPVKIRMKRKKKKKRKKVKKTGKSIDENERKSKGVKKKREK